MSKCVFVAPSIHVFFISFVLRAQYTRFLFFLYTLFSLFFLRAQYTRYLVFYTRFCFAHSIHAFCCCIHAFFSSFFISSTIYIHAFGFCFMQEKLKNKKTLFSLLTFFSENIFCFFFATFFVLTTFLFYNFFVKMRFFCNFFHFCAGSSVISGEYRECEFPLVTAVLLYMVSSLSRHP